MREQWTDDLRKRMEGRRGKAPEGLLDDIRSEMTRRGLAPIPASRPARVVPLWLRSAAAAAVVLAVGLALWLYLDHSTRKPGMPQEVAKAMDDRQAHPDSRNVPPAGHAAEAIAFPYDNGSPSGKGLLAMGQAPTITAEEQPMTAGSGIQPTGEPTSKPSTQPKSDSQAPSETVSHKPSHSRTSRQGMDEYMAYGNTTHDDGRLSVDMHYSGMGASGNGNGAPQHTLMMDNAIPYGAYPISMASAKAVFMDETKTTEPEKADHHRPIKAGVSVRYRVNKRWSVQSGLTYSYLSSDFTHGEGPKAVTRTQRLHYVGIPLNASYSLIQHKGLEVYATAGGEVEKLVSGKSDDGHTKANVSEHRPQFAVGASVGAEYHLLPNVSVYAEPGVSHYPDNGSDVKNYYKEHPTHFNLKIGVRIDLNKK